jgi:hypothetical protein
MMDLEEELLGYPCKFVPTNNMGQRLWCGSDKEPRLWITLFTKEGILTFPSLEGHGEPREVEIATSFRLGAFHFVIVADEDDYLYALMAPGPMYKGLGKYIIYDFGLNLDVREIFKILSNHLVVTPFWVNAV